MGTSFKMHSDKRNYSQFACIGSGFSAIGLGATLQRWYGLTDIKFFERSSELGGMWFTNKYPGMFRIALNYLYSKSLDRGVNKNRLCL